ncbi:pyridoxal-dependent decarboxylase, exosortase A system-associated [Zooshikella ganghwensis]|uniref:pyridoxal-dependent decarboxylase, exosortase A system-associated n=1 Tax=Zooshikella ganghwensis TaxID=202772 RepID=UPI0004069B02|nr:pyridoxal-dependent decarboxylase, exosortase A system-associated [Zooshikella ganghwensis]
MDKRPQHAPLWGISTHNNEMMVAQRPISEVANIIGRTPFYLYDRQLLTKRVTELKAYLPDPLKLHYAIKANPMPAVVNHMAGIVDGLDVASQLELHTALNSGMSADNISFAGPGKQDHELQSAIAAGILINVESAHELQRIVKISQQLHCTARVALRVNPDYELKTSGMKMSGGPKQFGIDAEQIPDILKNWPSSVQFCGFHIFSGSQNLRSEAIIDAQTKTFALAESLAQFAPTPISTLNIGGGLGIPYFPGENRLDLEPIRDNLQKLINQHHKALNHCELVIELGRYLVGEAGVYISRIIDIKESRGTTFYIVDGGLHHHLANSGNFGQVIRKNYPVLLANKVSDTTLQPVQVVGPLCTPLDILGDKVMLPAAQVGDLIAITQSGAYGPTASPQQFLSHPSVTELLL